MWPTYCAASMPLCTGDSPTRGLGPSGFGYDRPPLPFMATRPPEGSARTAVGYQPTGMNPSTRLRSVETSITATALASEQATKRRFLSALSAKALGVMPRGWRGVIDTLIDSTTLNSLSGVAPT